MADVRNGSFFREGQISGNGRGNVLRSRLLRHLRRRVTRSSGRYFTRSHVTPSHGDEITGHGRDAILSRSSVQPQHQPNTEHQRQFQGPSTLSAVRTDTRMSVVVEITEHIADVHTAHTPVSAMLRAAVRVNSPLQMRGRSPHFVPLLLTDV